MKKREAMSKSCAKKSIRLPRKTGDHGKTLSLSISFPLSLFSLSSISYPPENQGGCSPGTRRRKRRPPRRMRWNRRVGDSISSNGGLVGCCDAESNHSLLRRDHLPFQWPLGRSRSVDPPHCSLHHPAYLFHGRHPPPRFRP